MISFKALYKILTGVLMFSLISCYPDEKIEADLKVAEPSNEPLDQLIQSRFLDPYGVAVRYRYVDRYVDPDKRVTPPKQELVEPMLDFLNEFWIEPYMQVENGETFFKNHVPAEIILIGSYMFNADGTRTLGTADAGARITLTEVNFVDKADMEWVFLQLGTIYHEFAHIIHQRYNLPANFQNISPQGYTSAGSWYTLSDEEALIRGFVSPYGTSSFNEDYAEIVAFYLYHPQFFDIYINDEADCTTPECVQRNEGRVKIRTKLAAILSHYERNTGVDLTKVRELIQAKF